jgi:hypothetical protein
MPACYGGTWHPQTTTLPGQKSRPTFIAVGASGGKGIEEVKAHDAELMSASKPYMSDKRQTWQVRYQSGVLSREISTREEAISLAREELDKHGGPVEAVLGPNFQLIDRAQLERECAKRRGRT